MSEKTALNGLSKRCARFVHELEYKNIPDDARQYAVRNFIDYIACSLGGWGEGFLPVVGSYVDAFGGAPTSTIVGSFQKTDAASAALANGYLCHASCMDDVHQKAITHLAATVTAASLAVAEKRHCSGEDLLTAMTAGYDIMTRVGEAVMPYHYTIWHITGTAGAFGAAAAAAKLYGLTEEQTLHALGLAGSQAAGLWEFKNEDGSVKFFHCGKAAMNGIMAAALAAAGMTSCSTILEGKQGFFKGYSDDGGKASAFDDMGEVFKITETVHKPYACCRHSHSTVDAVLELRKDPTLSLEEIEEIQVHTYALNVKMNGNYNYDELMSSRFCLPFIVAAAFVHGKAGIAEFRTESKNDPRLTALIPKVTFTTDPRLTELFPQKWGSRVVVKTRSATYEKEVLTPKGDPDNPLSDAEMDQKMLDLAEIGGLAPANARMLLARCRDVARTKDMSAFFDLAGLGGR